ncbi:MAG: hypothetical protein E6Z25_00145 [Negativicoccus succinicivorans]|uniref:gp53-like domain-containing protein n=1 Tax=Negativicoccus succinicivorans TaxID=620903 RepID=UPI00290990E7|nr:hypothetical protein [Negativicoccus succinicivorans]MDU5914471.1 hypothetical protein [Negativicoccus succinicivorans]
MANWSKTRVTDDGLKLNAEAVAANKSIDIYAAKGGTGNNLTLDTMPVTFDIAGVKQKDKAVIVTLQIDNKGAQSEQTFNRIALFARLDAGAEVKTPYAVVESDTLENIPARSSQYKVLRVDVILAYTGAENVTVTPTIELGITEAQARVIVTTSIGDHDGDPKAHQVMAHNVNDTTAPKGNNGTIRGLLDGLANRIKAITGGVHWFDDPDITLAKTKERLDALNNRVGTLDFIPNSRIGTTEDKLATLGYNGRFDKERLPDGVVYENDFDIYGWSSGYAKQPGGFLIQWGTIPQVGRQGSATVSYPRSFSSVFTVLACPAGTPNVIEDNGTFHVVSFSTYNFKVQYSGDNNPGPSGNWIALGRD